MKHETPIIILDPDHAGHLIAMLADYHTYVLEAWHHGEVFTNDGVADTCYLLGNIEGRLLYDGITQEDLDIMEDWEAELEDWKNLHNGNIICMSESSER